MEGKRTMSFGKYLKDVKAGIRETDVAAVRKAVEGLKGKAGDGNGAGPVLIDVREKDEWTEGYIPGARWISRGFLEQRIEDQVSVRSGRRSCCSRRCCASARAGWDRRPGSTWQRPVSARSGSSTTTSSTRRTCSGRSCTRPIGWGCPRSS